MALLNKIYEIIKKIIFSVFLLYSFNLIMVPTEIIITINCITVLSVSIFGFPALMTFLVIFFVIY